MDEFLERLERLENIIEDLIAHKPKTEVVLVEPKALKLGVRPKKELVAALKKLKESPNYDILNNQLGLTPNINININTIPEEGLEGFTYIPKLSKFISQVAEIDLSKIRLQGVNPKRELERFCNYYINRVDDRDRPFYTKYTHWKQAFGNWCRNAQKFNSQYPRVGEPRFQNDIARPDYEEREKRDHGYEGGLLEVSDAYEEYEEEFLSR